MKVMERGCCVYVRFVGDVGVFVQVCGCVCGSDVFVIVCYGSVCWWRVVSVFVAVIEGRLLCWVVFVTVCY